MRLIYVLALAASATALNATTNNTTDDSFTNAVFALIEKLPPEDRPQAAHGIIKLLEEKIKTMDENPETQEDTTT